jgi:hypothetical protein
MQQGLVPSAGPGSHEWARQKGRELQDMIAGDRTMSVYLSNDKSWASVYAANAAEVTKGHPVLLQVEIPACEQPKLVMDEQARMHGVRFQGTIKPEWIVGRIAAEPVER